MERKNESNGAVVPVIMAVMMFFMLFLLNVPFLEKKMEKEEQYFKEQKEVIMKITEKEKEQGKYYTYGRSKGVVYKIEVDEKYYYKKIVGETMYGYLEVGGNRAKISAEEDMVDYTYEEIEEIEFEERNT